MLGGPDPVPQLLAAHPLKAAIAGSPLHLQLQLVKIVDKTCTAGCLWAKTYTQVHEIHAKETPVGKTREQKPEQPKPQPAVAPTKREELQSLILHISPRNYQGLMKLGQIEKCENIFEKKKHPQLDSILLTASLLVLAWLAFSGRREADRGG